jgi:hypothetical protein
MAIRVNGQEKGDLGEPFRKRQFRHNSSQGFRNAAPYDSRTGNDSPLWPTVKIKIGVTDEEILPDDHGVVTVWRNPIKGDEAIETSEKIRVYLDWMHNDQSIPEDTEVLCVEFPDENLWRVFIDQDPAAVEIERCSDKKTVLAFDIVLNEQLGKLSDNIGKVVRLRDSAFFETDCWKIKEKSDCIPEICPDVCLISPDCKTCYGCYKLTQCVDPSIVKITDPQNLCIEHDKGSGSFFDLIADEGGVVLLDDGFCYTVEHADNCIDSEEVKLIGLAEDCQSCLDCYRLELCPPDPDFPQSFPDETIYIYKDNHKLSEGDVVKYEGRCYKVFVGFNNCPEDAIHVTSKLEKFDDCKECVDSGCYEFKSCSEGLYDSMIVRSAKMLDLDSDYQDDKGYVDVDLDQYIGLVVQTVDGKCFTVSKIYEGCDNAVDVIIVEAYQECDCCGVYLMEGCYGAEDIYTYDDFCYQWKKGGGQLFKRAEDGLCYILRDLDQTGKIGVPFTVEFEWGQGATCDYCEEPTYTLTPNCPDCDTLTGGSSECDSEEGTKKAGGATKTECTNEDLRKYVGEYIKIEGVCYYVSLSDPACEVTLQAPLQFTGGYPDCATCQKTCLWVVTDVYVKYNEIRQERKQIIVDAICREDDELIIDIEDCP